MKPRILPFNPDLELATVRMWRRSFQGAMGLPRISGPDQDYWEQLAYLRSQYAGSTLTHVLHPRSPRVLGFMSQRQREIDHLYLDESIQRLGIGTRLLNQAKAQSPKGLELYTFAANSGAQRFYERHGFVEQRRGVAAAEDNPWATEPAQLADVLYVWSS